jgi:hypothetical protein
VRFLQTRTFDITVTDNPAVPMTGVSAFPIDFEEVQVMGKKEALKERLLNAGMSEDVIDERLSAISDDEAKEYDGIPEAILLKEFGDEDESVETVELDPSVMKEIRQAIREEVSAALEGASLEIDAGSDVLKESSEIAELKEAVENLTEMVQQLLDGDTERVKETLSGSSRKAKRLVSRFKEDKKTVPQDEEEDTEDEEMDGEDEEEKEMILDADGVQHSSLSEMIMGRR